MHGLTQDLQFALRFMRKRPGASVVIVLTLALGLGLNATFFSVYYGMALRPLPFADPDELVMISKARFDDAETYLSPSTADLYDLGDSQTLAGLEAYSYRNFNLEGEGPPERLSGVRVTHGLFSMLGARAAHGRDFRSADGQPGAEPVAILSDSLWRRSFGGDPAVLGSLVRVDGASVRVVGIMPPRFAFPLTQEIWLPLELDRASASRTDRVELLGRRVPGVGPEAVEAALTARLGELERSYPEIYRDQRARVQPLHEAWMPPVTQIAALAMQGLASLVLLIVCANVANMVLAQANLRRQERALRTALGASKGRLLRQNLVESLLLTAAGGLLGLLLTAWHGDLMMRISAVPIPFWLSFEVDAPVLLFALCATVLTGIGLGIAPSLRALSGDRLVEALKAGGRAEGGAGGGGRRGWLRGGLIVAEYALAVVVLAGALLMLRAYDRLQNADTGFAVEQRAALKLSLPTSGEDLHARGLDAVRRAVEAATSLPEVEAAAAVSHLPIDRGAGRQDRLLVSGREEVEGGEPKVSVYGVAENFFGVLEIPLRSGRAFTGLEHSEGRPIAIVSAGLAAELWPAGAEDALGRQVRLKDAGTPWLEVVGVARDLEPGEPLAGIGRLPDHQIYVPLAFKAAEGSRFLPATPAVVVRSAASPGSLLPALRATLAESVPGVPVFALETMDQVLRRHYFAQHIWSRMFAFIALVALGIAAIGAYGVSAYAVSRRIREIGIRLALGAAPRRVMAAVVGRGLAQALLGLALGLAISIPMASAMAGLLHGVSLFDPAVLGGVLLLLGSVAFLATFVPARRAAEIDPVVALRES